MIKEIANLDRTCRQIRHQRSSHRRRGSSSRIHCDCRARKESCKEAAITILRGALALCRDLIRDATITRWSA
jgi:hypothetical protein